MIVSDSTKFVFFKYEQGIRLCLALYSTRSTGDRAGVGVKRHGKQSGLLGSV